MCVQVCAGVFGVGGAVPGEHGVCVWAESVLRSGCVHRFGCAGGGRGQVSSKNVCSFGTESWRAEQAICGQVLLSVPGFGGGLGGDELWAQVPRMGLQTGMRWI